MDSAEELLIGRYGSWKHAFMRKRAKDLVVDEVAPWDIRRGAGRRLRPGEAPANLGGPVGHFPAGAAFAKLEIVRSA
jgi:hypothetical protein